MRAAAPLLGTLLAVVPAAGCAGALAGGARTVPISAAAADGWRTLAAGDDRAGGERLARAAAAAPADVVAQLGRASLAYERGESAVAFDGYLRILESAAAVPEAAVLAPAAAARLETLVGEVEIAERRAAEQRLLALPREALPWPARAALAEVATGIARRRADAALLAAEARRAGCLGGDDAAVMLTGILGRLPYLDLEADEAARRGGGEPARRLERAGCRLIIPAVDGLSGVRVLRAEVAVARGGAHDLVIAFPGPALVRVDGGAWHRHGGTRVYGPRWSAARRRLGAGRHQLEVRLGTYGGAADVILMVTPAGAAGEGAGAGFRFDAPGSEPVAELVAAQAADWAGDLDGALELVARLARRPRFAVGLALAARISTRDLTRPANITRDAARALFRKAVAVDGALARPWRDLATLEGADRPREAAEHAERALRATPSFWPAELAHVEALRARGLERDADRALERAAARGCAAVEPAMRRAEDRDRIAEEERLAARLGACDAHASGTLERLRVQGDLAALEAELRRRLPTSADPQWLRTDLAQTLLARGQARAAVAELEALVAAAPRDVQLYIRLADAHVAAGAPARAREVMGRALARFPTRAEVRVAARALGLKLPFDPFRLDGKAVIAAFVASRRRYESPAVLVLDRTVGRVFADGAQLVLTHNIVRVQTKDGIDRWGEVAIPEGAEVLTLRTHKPDGSVREPEEIYGKQTISAPDLAVGDFVEWETLEVEDPADAFAPGFLGERFYFQSVEAPLDRSEYLVVTPAGARLEWDRRAGAPQPTTAPGPDGTQVTRFLAEKMAQLFAERSSVTALDWIPSVRVSSGVSAAGWSRYLADQLAGVARGSPALRKVAAEIAAGKDKNGDPAAALVRWINDRIEPEAELVEPATSTLARGRGNRTALMVALAQAMGIDAQVVFARPLTSAAADAPVTPQELDDFAETLVRFPAHGGRPARFADPRLRKAPFGYVPPAVNGAPVIVPGPSERGPALETVASSVPDARSVVVEVKVAADGEASARVTEDVTGWPALEWIEMLDRAGKDRGKLRQDFEQRWLSQHFPGATLGDLQVDLPGPADAAGTVRARYGFTHPELGTRDGGVLKLAPTFYRSQPGRRYATEPGRRTTLLLGFDVPVDLEARFELPRGARVLDAGASAVVDAGQARFAEQREIAPAAAGGSPRVTVRRQARLPLVRVTPKDYPDVAGKLRRVDPLEQAEIRVELPATP